MLRSSTAKAFCAGGDVKFLSQDRSEKGKALARSFFAEEYKLNHILGTSKKPVRLLLFDCIVVYHNICEVDCCKYVDCVMDHWHHYGRGHGNFNAWPRMILH
jgi:hypothetical protein